MPPPPAPPSLPAEPVAAGPSSAGPGTRPTRVRLVPWEDATLDVAGVDPRSAYVELFWLPVLGPSATLLVRRFADLLEGSPGGCDVDLGDVARALGIGGMESRHAPLGRALRRCARFGLLRPEGAERVAVRRLLGPLPRHHLARLPESLQERHCQWERPPAADAALRRAHLLALDALALGEPPPAVERRLLRWGVHPALAYESAGWASSRAAVPVAGGSARSVPQPVGEPEPEPKRSSSARSVRTPKPVPPFER